MAGYSKHRIEYQNLSFDQKETLSRIRVCVPKAVPRTHRSLTSVPMQADDHRQRKINKNKEHNAVWKREKEEIPAAIRVASCFKTPLSELA